jgi:4-amino-4-deoxy-L-arabinose transferase-like glycosyltransferase
MIMLQFYVLQQGDRLVTFVGWFAMLTSLIAVSRIARSLGVSLRGQLLAAVFLGTLPMGIIQASSTVSDYVMAVWVLCAAVESMDMFVDAIRSNRLVFVSLSAGLAILTKPTAVAYLAPLAVFLAIILLRRLRLGRSLLWGLVAVILVVALNAGPLIRNAHFYGNPLGSPAQLGVHNNQLANLQGTMSNLIRNFSMHLGTPWRYVNKGLGVVVQQLHRWLGVDINDPRTTSVGVFRIHGITTAEDVAGNPMQAYSILLAVTVLLLRRKRLGRVTLVYALVALSSMVVFSWLFKWQSFGGRYHIAFFALFAPVAGCLLTAFVPKFWSVAAGGLFLVAAWPWLFSIQSRPLIPVAGDSLTNSILVESRQNLYFANAQYLINTYTSLIGTIDKAGCNQVGIALNGLSPEYLIWVLLDAPRPDLRVEWLVSGGPPGLTNSPDFSPCAVICQHCGADVQEIEGLPLVYTRDEYQLFMLAPAP